MYYALGAGELFDITAKNEFVETLIGAYLAEQKWSESLGAPTQKRGFFFLVGILLD
jgi:hypothetical protein